MVGLLDYFQPRRNVGLLGLPMEGQVIGDGLLGSAMLQDLLGSWGDHKPGVVTDLPNSFRSQLFQGEPSDQIGIPSRFMGGPTDQPPWLTFMDNGPEAQAPGLLTLPQKRIAADRFGGGLLGVGAVRSPDQPSLLGDEPQASRIELATEPVYPFVNGGPRDDGAPVHITVRPLREIQNWESNGQGGAPIPGELKLLADIATPTRANTDGRQLSSRIGDDSRVLSDAIPDNNWISGARYAGDGLSLPIPRPAPRLPPIPPEFWPGTPQNKLWTDQFIRGLQGLVNTYSRRSTVSGGNNDDPDCRKEREEAAIDCADAAANGWRGIYGTGPYKKRSPGPWTIEDCIRGRVSQRCGGNRVD